MQTHRYVLAFVLLAGGGVARASCPNGIQSIVVFSNGIGTTLDEALITVSTVLAPAVLQTVDTTVDPTCIQFGLAYDSQFLDSNNNVISTANMLAQIADAGVQEGIDWAANFWNYWNFVIQPPTWLENIQRTYITAATSAFQPDLLTQEAFYNSELALGYQVITVAHSQGNLYANQAWDVVTAVNGKSLFHLVSVATPAHSVASGDHYFTLTGDIITLVPGSLGPDITDDAPSECPTGIINPLSAGPYACHSFDDSYMSVQYGDNSRPAILNAIEGWIRFVYPNNINLLTNPQFDGSLSGWTPLFNLPVAVYDTALNAPGSAGGSAKTINGVDVPGCPTSIICVSTFSLVQYVPVISGIQYDFGGKVFIPLGQSSSGDGVVGVAFWDSNGNFVPSVGYSGNAVSSIGVWGLSNGTVQAPAGAVTVRLVLLNQRIGPTGSLQVNFDDIFFQRH